VLKSKDNGNAVAWEWADSRRILIRREGEKEGKRRKRKKKRNWGGGGGGVKRGKFHFPRGLFRMGIKLHYYSMNPTRQDRGSMFEISC